ncbi:hypothetical protein, partial [Streptosporangium sp. NPDC049304]|uniref:hypothetical protein n=1 Tax=Streptosporangium sp. NPDC049304 TaxID=3154830 RepID=UPI003422C96A
MLSRADADATRAARQVQQYAPTWLVMWSLRHRRFEAWQLTDPRQCRIIHAQSAAELWDLMQQADVEPQQISPPPPLSTLGLVPHPRVLPLGPDEQVPSHHFPQERGPVVIPSHDTPTDDRVNASTRQPGAITALRRLRTELHEHRIISEIFYDEGPPRLVLGADLTVWADHNGEFFTWGTTFMEEPAESAAADDVPQVAARIAERLDEHRT